MVHDNGMMMGNKRKRLPHRPKKPPRQVSLYRLLVLMQKDAERVAREPKVGRSARRHDGSGRKITPESHGLHEQPPYVTQLLVWR